MLYFGYGSNMNRRQLASRCPTAEFRFRGRLPGYRLAYTRFSPKRLCGVLDILPCAESEVWGAVFSLGEPDFAQLDICEFCNEDGYRRLPIDVEVEGNGRTRVAAIAYEVRTKLPEEIAPSDDYLGTVVAGARQCGLSEAYIERVVASARSLPPHAEAATP